MTNTGRRIALFLLIVSTLLIAAPAALAVGEVLAQADVPAIEVPEPAPVDDTPSWTYRYLIPTFLVLAVLAVVLTVVQYFVKVVGKRYRVVQ